MPGDVHQSQRRGYRSTYTEEVDGAAMKGDTAVVREWDREEERTADKKVEELIHMAQSITQGIKAGPEQQAAKGKTLRGG